MKILVIGNPISGGGKAKGAIDSLERLLSSRGHALDIFLTRGAGDAAARAASIDPEAPPEALIVVGGDGTLNAVLNGLLDPGSVPLTQFPFGTANMLSRELKLPSDPQKTVELVESDCVRWIDMGLIREEGAKASDSRRFLLLASAGFDAMVTETVKQHRKGRMGFHAYVGPILRTLSSYEPPRLTVRVEGGAAGEGAEAAGAMVVVGNTRNYGGLFSITDRAHVESGQLDVCVLTGGSIPDLLNYTIGAYFGNLSRRRDVTYLTGERVRIAADREVAVQVDGDHWGRTPVEIEVVPGAVPVMAGQEIG